MFQRRILQDSDHQSTAIALLSGGLARTVAVTAVSPLELVRTKMQSQKMQFSEVKEALKITVKSEGILGLWKGFMPTLYRDVPFSALFWPFYEVSKKFCTKSRLLKEDFSTHFVSSAAAGTVACAITLPMDVIKTRRQIELGETELSKGGKSSSSTLAIAKEIVRNEGAKGLFSGLAPRVLKVAPACAIVISSYEYCKAFFRDSNVEATIVNKL